MKCGGRVGLAEERPSARVRWWRGRMLLLAMLQRLPNVLSRVKVCRVVVGVVRVGGSIACIYFKFVYM